MVVAGSPGMSCKREKTTTVIPNRTGIINASRRRI
jgi:hypothetical protein